MKKVSFKFIALLLALCLLPLLPLALARPAAALPAPGELRVALISDSHYFPEDMAGGYGQAFRDGQIVGHPIETAPGVLRSALRAIKERALRGEIDYLLIPGDLTREGEKHGHEKLAAILEQFEAETGIPVAVIPGNHDIDNWAARDFTGGVQRDADHIDHEDFYNIYRNLGYDLGVDRYTPGFDVPGSLSYAADLGPGGKYRLVALDTGMQGVVTPELLTWAVGQCEEAVANGQTVIGMGHHNLNEQIKGQLIVMQGEGFENMRELSEALADAGMHFYFSGHLHMSEISPWYSDKGEVLYDTIVPGLYSFPGDYRVVNFSTVGAKSTGDLKITADIQSYPLDEALRVSTDNLEGVIKNYLQPFYPDNLEVSFGWIDMDGTKEGLPGFVKAALRRTLKGQLEDLQKAGGLAALVKASADFAPLNDLMAYLDAQVINQPDKIFALIDGLIDDLMALPVSKLPCKNFPDLNFGSATRPGTAADMADAVIAYMFWKDRDPADDPFIQDVLRRMKNGELIDQLLDFAIPKVLETLGAEILPLLANVDVGLLNRMLSGGLGALACPLLFVTGLLPGTKDTISATLYNLASRIITSSSPSGVGTHAFLTYEGPVADPAKLLAGPTFRLPYDLKVTYGKDCKSAEVTWYTKDSLDSPGLKLTDKAGNAVTGVTITTSTEYEDITANQVDLGLTKLLGTRMHAAKHTARLTGLKPGKAYKLSAGDRDFDWWGPRQALSRESKVLEFFRQVWNWFIGLWRHMINKWNNWRNYGG